MDLQRNLQRNIDSESCVLDDFAPGWRDAVKGLKLGEIIARGKLIEHWLGLIRKVGFKEARQLPLIRGATRQPLYWLVLVAKNDLARKFWDALNRPKQGALDF